MISIWWKFCSSTKHSGLSNCLKEANRVFFPSIRFLMCVFLLNAHNHHFFSPHCGKSIFLGNKMHFLNAVIYLSSYFTLVNLDGKCLCVSSSNGREIQKFRHSALTSKVIEGWGTKMEVHNIAVSRCLSQSIDSSTVPQYFWENTL